MKKKLLVVLAAAAVFASSALFVSCGGNSSDSSSKSFSDSSTPSPSAVIPEGYAKFEDEYISFAYPSSWSSEADGELYALENEELTVAVAKFTDVEKNNFIAAMYTATLKNAPWNKRAKAQRRSRKFIIKSTYSD